MAGVIAGTAILKSLSPSKKLKTITITINNSCNLSCPHCYLQYEKENFVIKEPTINSIFNADFEHLAIVGKEPLVNNASISILDSLAERCYLNNKTISIITNGIGLSRLKTETINYFNYIDVSFDGGPETYQLYRKASFKKVINNILNVQAKSNVPFNALNTLSSGTINNIEDMMAIKEFANFQIIMFSPYLLTENNGANKVSFVELFEILKRLSQSQAFMTTDKAFILLDIYHFKQEGISTEDVKNLVSTLGLVNKVRLIKKDPLNYGIIRVTYDDYVLTPYESIHPKHYQKSNYVASKSSLNLVFETMQHSFQSVI